jgi:DNA-binding NtrC family response regulator
VHHDDGARDGSSAVAALKRGARDLLEKPISYERLDASVMGALEVTALRREVRVLREQGRSEGVIVGGSPRCRRSSASSSASRRRSTRLC